MATHSNILAWRIPWMEALGRLQSMGSQRVGHNWVPSLHFFTSFLRRYSIKYIWMWELDHKVGWVQKNWCFWPVVLEKSLESPLDCREIKPVSCKGTQSWIFIGRTDAEAPILWPPNVKNWLIGKHPDAGKDWRQEEKGMTEDEMAGWHHQPDGHEFEQALEDGEGQGSLVCCSPWGCKESDVTERLNSNNKTIAEKFT